MGKKTKLMAAAVAVGAAVSLGVASPAMANPGGPGRYTYPIGIYPTCNQCVSAAQANYPIHGAFYLCEHYGSMWYLYMQ